MATHVVCVLGKALQDDGTPTLGLIERVEHGIQLFNEYRLNSLPCILLFSGGNGNPKANKPEADVMSQIAISKGVDPKNIFIENNSKNSIETILNVRSIVDGKKFASLVVITSQYHMKRIEIMMEAIMEQRIEWYVIGIRGTTEAKDIELEQRLSKSLIENLEVYGIPFSMPEYYFNKYPAKIVHFIRHGEAEHNKIPNYLHPDPKLTERGLSQISERKYEVESIPVDLVVTSPLSRALQTTSALFSGRKVPTIVNSDLSEFRKQPPDFGRLTSELAREFPQFNFGHLPLVWWRNLDSEEPITALKLRVARFLKWLRSREERNIVVVSHGAFLFELLEIKFQNLEMKRLEIGWTNKKFDEFGNLMYFPGNTIVAQVPINSQQHKLITDICGLLQSSSIGKYYSFLPPSSLHVTITKGLTPGLKLLNSETKSLNWKETHELLEKKIADVMSSSPWTIFRMKASTFHASGVLSILLKPDGRSESATHIWRERIASKLMNGGDFDPFHVTLAYRIAPIPQNLQHDLQEIKMQVMSMLFNFDILELDPPKFCYFHDMSEFVPFNQPKGFSLIIGYHPPSGKRFGFRFTANSGLELVRFSKQKSGWSHFVVFPAIEGNMSPRFMLYNRGNGKAHIGEILSSYQMSFSCESNLNAGYSHVVSIGSFIFCYSQTEDTVTILSLQGNKMIPKQLPALLGNPVGGNLFIIPISESALFVYHQSSGNSLIARITEGSTIEILHNFSWIKGIVNLSPLHLPNKFFHFMYFMNNIGTVVQIVRDSFKLIELASFPFAELKLTSFLMDGKEYLFTVEGSQDISASVYSWNKGTFTKQTSLPVSKKFEISGSLFSWVK